MTKNQQTESKQKDNNYSGTLTLNPLVRGVRVLVDLGEERGLTFVSSHLCKLGLFSLYAIIAKEWHSPTGRLSHTASRSITRRPHTLAWTAKIHRVLYCPAGRDGERRVFR